MWAVNNRDVFSRDQVDDKTLKIIDVRDYIEIFIEIGVSGVNLHFTIS